MARPTSIVIPRREAEVKPFDSFQWPRLTPPEDEVTIAFPSRGLVPEATMIEHQYQDLRGHFDAYPSGFQPRAATRPVSIKAPGQVEPRPKVDLAPVVNQLERMSESQKLSLQAAYENNPIQYHAEKPRAYSTPRPRDDPPSYTPSAYNQPPTPTTARQPTFSRSYAAHSYSEPVTPRLKPQSLSVQTTFDLRRLEDCDVPLPEPYNPAYPHPITAYASPGVNPYSRALSGYDKVLHYLLETDRDLVKGSILASESDDVLPPALSLVLNPGEGNGIPERLWSRFESAGAGIGRFPPVAGLVPSHTGPGPLPPRFAGLRGVFPGLKTCAVPQSPLPCFASAAPSPIDSAVSPFYKTELCQMWGEQGVCRYGQSCQFAHGLHDLRAPTPIVPLPTPSPTTSGPGRHPEGTFPFPSTLAERKASLPGPIHIPRYEPRRASVPHPLASVNEFDDDLPTPWWRSHTDQHAQSAHHHPVPMHRPAPIGSERITPPSSASKVSPMPNLAAWSRAFTSRSIPSNHHHSLSSSTASSRLSGYAASTESMESVDEYQRRASATSDKIYLPPHVQARRRAEGHVGKEDRPFESGETATDSTFLDFSTGKSIWC